MAGRSDRTSRHISQRSIFAGYGLAEGARRVVFRQEVDLEAEQRIRRGSFSAANLDLGHSSASPLARSQWKSLFG